VEQVDAAGDALISFGKGYGKHWVKTRNWCNLSLSDAQFAPPPRAAKSKAEPKPDVKSSTSFPALHRLPSTIPEETRKDGDASHYESSGAAKVDRQMRDLLDKKMDKTKLAATVLSKSQSENVVEFRWYLNTGRTGASPISQLSEADFMTELQSALENYGERREKAVDQNSQQDVWKQSWAFEMLEYMPEGPGTGAKGYALLLMPSFRHAAAITDDYVDRPAGWPILRMCGQVVAEAFSPTPGWLRSQLRAISQTGSSRSPGSSVSKGSKGSSKGSNVSGKGWTQADMAKREADKAAREAIRKKVEAGKAAANAKSKRLVLLKGIPEKIWESTTQRSSIKEKLEEFVKMVCKSSPSLPKHKFQLSFSSPKPAPSGCCWLEFDYDDQEEGPSVDMADSFSSGMSAIKPPYSGLEAETSKTRWAGNYNVRW